jgi:uncharacterized protein YqhQ
MDNSLVKGMMLPGLLLQKITTKKPDKYQLEVALAAVKEVLEREKDKSAKSRIHEMKKNPPSLQKGSRRKNDKETGRTRTKA